jgi:hypothetical protein
VNISEQLDGGKAIRAASECPMTYQQALAQALDIAQRRQRAAYLIELADGWVVSSYPPLHARAVSVEPPPPEPDEDGEEDK